MFWTWGEKRRGRSRPGWVRWFRGALFLVMLANVGFNVVRDQRDSTSQAPTSTILMPPERIVERPGDVNSATTEDLDIPTTSFPTIGATDIASMEESWAANRAAIVARIEAEGYGINDDNVLVGPAGFEIDLDDCPADWSNTEGLDDSIAIGHTTALSGSLAAYGDLSAGMVAYFDYVNDTGGIGGLPIELTIRDDGYETQQTITVVDELLASDAPFAIQTLGSPNSLAVYDTLNDNCVPHPLTISGHPAWGDPIGHPWTTGQQMSFATEALLWVTWIQDNMADQLPVTVAGLVMDNEFGLIYEDSMTTYAEEFPDIIAEFIVVRHDPAAPILDDEMASIAAVNPDVFISMTAGFSCFLAVDGAAESGLTASGAVRFTPSGCQDPHAYMIPARDAGDGFLVVGGGGKPFSDPEYADDPFVQWANATMSAAGLDTSVALHGSGFGVVGWPLVETLRIAAELDGGLTRANLILALRSFDANHPAMIDGVSFTMNGADDAYFVESSEVARWDAAAQSWIRQGPVLDINGLTPSCSWTATACEFPR